MEHVQLTAITNASLRSKFIPSCCILHSQILQIVSLCELPNAMAHVDSSPSCGQRVAAFVEQTGFTAFQIRSKSVLSAAFLAYSNPLVSARCAAARDHCSNILCSPAPGLGLDLISIRRCWMKTSCIMKSSPALNVLRPHQASSVLLRVGLLLCVRRQGRHVSLAFHVSARRPSQCPEHEEQRAHFELQHSPFI